MTGEVFVLPFLFKYPYPLLLEMAIANVQIVFFPSLWTLFSLIASDGNKSFLSPK